MNFRIIEYKSAVWNSFALADVECGEDGAIVHIGQPVLVASTFDDLLLKIDSVLKSLNQETVRMEL